MDSLINFDNANDNIVIDLNADTVTQQLTKLGNTGFNYNRDGYIQWLPDNANDNIVIDLKFLNGYPDMRFVVGKYECVVSVSNKHKLEMSVVTYDVDDDGDTYMDTRDTLNLKSYKNGSFKLDTQREMSVPAAELDAC